MSHHDGAPVRLAVSTVIFALRPDHSGRPVLWTPLVRRTREPQRGLWALPGGWLPPTEELEAADATVALATQALTQARDRFAAGVTSNLEVTQAQEAMTEAADVRLDVLYRHNLAKAALARAVGTAEQAVSAYLGGNK